MATQQEQHALDLTLLRWAQGKKASDLPVADRRLVEAAMARVERHGTAPQRQTQALSESYRGSYDEQESWLGEPTLDPKNWKALADRRVPWPQDLDPKYATRMLSKIFAARLMDQQAGMMGRRLQDMVGPDAEF